MNRDEWQLGDPLDFSKPDREESTYVVTCLKCKLSCFVDLELIQSGLFPGCPGCDDADSSKEL